MIDADARRRACRCSRSSPARRCATSTCVGITIPYELTYTNILETLDLAGIAASRVRARRGRSARRRRRSCVFNPSRSRRSSMRSSSARARRPSPTSSRLTAAPRQTGCPARRRLPRSRRSPASTCRRSTRCATDSERRLRRGVAAQVTRPARVDKRVVADLDSVRAPVEAIVPFMDVVHDRFGIEVLRGCTRGCRFCQAGMVYRPVRERSADTIVRDVMAGLACTGYDEVSLTSLSTTDHSQLEEVLRRLQRRLEGSGVSVSLPSLRVDAFGVEMARLVSAGGKKSGLTFAPEAGTQRMRDVINKNVTEEDLLGSVERAFAAGWRRVKLYFMIGLPTETDDDIRGIGELVAQGVPHGPRGDAAGTAWRAARRGLRLDVRAQDPDAVSVGAADPARGGSPPSGRACGSRCRARASSCTGTTRRSRSSKASWRAAAERSRRRSRPRGVRGARLRRVDRALQPRALARGVRRRRASIAGAIANRERALDEPLPWDHISAGVSKRYLERERERALERRRRRRTAASPAAPGATCAASWASTSCLAGAARG